MVSINSSHPIIMDAPLYDETWPAAKGKIYYWCHNRRIPPGPWKGWSKVPNYWIGWIVTHKDPDAGKLYLRMLHDAAKLQHPEANIDDELAKAIQLPRPDAPGQSDNGRPPELPSNPGLAYEGTALQDNQLASPPLEQSVEPYAQPRVDSGPGDSN